MDKEIKKLRQENQQLKEQLRGLGRPSINQNSASPIRNQSTTPKKLPPNIPKQPKVNDNMVLYLIRQFQDKAVIDPNDKNIYKNYV